MVLLMYLRKRVPNKATRATSSGRTSVVFNSAYSRRDVEGGRSSHAEEGMLPPPVTRMSLENSFVSQAAFPVSSTVQQRPEPKRKVVTYGPTGDHPSPLDECLQGRWVHGEEVSLKQDLVALLQMDDPQVGDFAVLQNPPGHELWGILVVVMSVDGHVKARKTEVQRLGDAGRFLLKPSRLTNGEPIYLVVPTFGEVLVRLSANGPDAHLVAVPLQRGVDILTKGRLTLLAAREAELANASITHPDDDPATHSLRVALRGFARLVFQKCWINDEIAEQILSSRDTPGSFVVWQKPQHRSHLVLSMRKGGAHEYSFKHFDIRRRGAEVILHLGPSAKGGHDEQLKCRSIEELVVALSSPDIPLQVPCRLTEGLLSTTRLDDVVERSNLAMLDWFSLVAPGHESDGTRETSL